MLFITDKVKQVQMKLGDVVKLTLLHETTSFKNTGDTTAIIHYSKDGYAWKPLITVEPNSTLPVSLDKDILYVRLLSKTAVELTATKPIPRESKDDKDSTHIDMSALIHKDELTAYVKKGELNDLITHPDISQFLTKAQILALMPQIPAMPDLSDYATKSELNSKASQAVLNALREVVTQKASTESVTALIQQLNALKMQQSFLNESKADKRAIDDILKILEQTVNVANKAQSDATTAQSIAINRVSKDELEQRYLEMVNLASSKADQSDFTALADTVEEKASMEWVSQNTNFILGLIQDKANKVYVDELFKRIRIISAIINLNDDEPFSADGFKQELVTLALNTMLQSDEYQTLNQISLQNQEDVKVLRSDVDEHKVFTGFAKDIDLYVKVQTILI